MYRTIKLFSLRPFAAAATILSMVALSTIGWPQQKGGGAGGGAGGGGGNQSSTPQGGGSATAEAQARMYQALDGSIGEIIAKLERERAKGGKLENVRAYILYDSRTVSDVMMARTFKLPLDALYANLEPTQGVAVPPTAPESLVQSDCYGAAFAPDVQAMRFVTKNNKRLDVPAAVAGLSLTGIISTLTSVGAISTSWVTATSTASGVAGPTDADAFLAARAWQDFAESGNAVSVYAPALLPLPRFDGTNRPLLTSPLFVLANVPSPMEELFELQGAALDRLLADQAELQSDLRQFQHVAPPNVDAASPLWVAYLALSNDIKSAIGWSPSVSIGVPVSPSNSQGNNGQSQNQGGGSAPSVLPLGAIKGDIVAVRASLPANNMALAKALDDLESKISVKVPEHIGTLTGANLIDAHIRIIQALGSVASGLGTAIQPYGALSSMAPSAGAPDTVANIVLRGWQVDTLLNQSTHPDAVALLRLHLEMSQGTDWSFSWLFVYNRSSSAMGQLSYMVFGRNDEIKLAGSSLAYLSPRSPGRTFKGRPLFDPKQQPLEVRQTSGNKTHSCSEP